MRCPSPSATALATLLLTLGCTEPRARPGAPLSPDGGITAVRLVVPQHGRVLYRDQFLDPGVITRIEATGLPVPSTLHLRAFTEQGTPFFRRDAGFHSATASAEIRVRTGWETLEGRSAVTIIVGFSNADGVLVTADSSVVRLR